MMTISPRTDPLAEFERCRLSPTYFIDTYLKIRHPRLGTVPFALWPWQGTLVQRFQTERLLIVLKARQIGVSELATAYAYWLTRFHPSKTTLIVSKNEEASMDLMQRALFGQTHLPAWLQPGKDAIDGCTVAKANTSMLELAHRDKHGAAHPSVIQSLPATRNTGRGKPASLVILDEWAHQQFDKDIWTAIEPTIDAGGALIGISTANGLGNQFHKTWVHAAAGKNTFRPIFLSWRRHPERDDAWYTAKGSNMEPWQLHQEYPAEPTEAFIQSGRPVFDATYLATHGARIAQSVAPLSQSDGLTIWNEPIGATQDAEGKIIHAHRYIIAADVAEGTAQGDFDAACAYDRATWQQVAELHGRWPLEVYAAKLDALGRRYHNALIAVERNNHGHAVLLKLRDLGYPTLYHTHDELHPGAPPQPKPGWETTAKTKPLAIGDLASSLRSQTLLPRSQALLDEALVYAYQDNGSMSAPPSYHDDLVMSHAIAAHLLSQPDPSTQAMAMLSQWQTLVQGQIPASAFPGAPPSEYLPR